MSEPLTVEQVREALEPYRENHLKSCHCAICRLLESGFVEAAIRYDGLRKAVVAWVDSQSREGRLVKNSQAPMWLEYESAAAEMHNALRRLQGEK